MTAYLESFLRLNRHHRGLSVDITNMFNDLCRVAMMEDLFDMEELTGVDFSDLAGYCDMALMQDYSNWFWVEETDRTEGTTPSRGGSNGKWVPVPSNEGVPQGSPLSCLLAAIGLLKCVLAARKEMDN